MIHLDTSALVDALSLGDRTSARFEMLLGEGREMTICSLVAYEWLRGPRTPAELGIYGRLFPPAKVVAFGVEESEAAASLYRRLRRPRSREFDIAIAACAITHDATLWTLNPQDFKDLPGLVLL